MSHIVLIQTEIRDATAIQLACRRLQWPDPAYCETKLFSSSATGWAVQVPDWRYPVVCNVDTAQLAYDNFGGRWGDPGRLSQFLQAYAVERAKLEARRKGHTCLEQPLTDGSIKLTITVGGAT